MPTTTPEVHHLTEWTTDDIECSLDVVALLQDVFRADVSPRRSADGSPVWRVRPSGVVGIARTDDVVVVVRPRIPVENVLRLAGASATPWHDDAAPAGAVADLHLALARLFVRTVERTLGEGVLRGYRQQREDLLTVRGRIDLAEQIRRRPGRNLPLAVSYEEHDEDVLENRLIKSAAVALQRLRFDDEPVRRGLHRIVMTLQGVTAEPATQPHEVLWTRLNERYRPAVGLAQLVLDGTGIDLTVGGVAAQTLTLPMHEIFEDFLAHELGRRLGERGGRVYPQDVRWTLDADRTVGLRPDLVWDQEGHPVAVVDAKYQRVGPRDTHGDNAYQLLAYCTALGLPEGHLVYAEAVGPIPPPLRVVRGGPTIHLHALDLAAPFAEVMAQLDGIARVIASKGPPVAARTSPGVAAAPGA
ncbi:hypothetical protein Q6350_03645 [Isoptericola sp. b515]|uniref:McrC family protein n=1 Tax=Isoptericola sp. b515 TaxID=3064652 RepID=UPI002712A09B|nr:hypothetical protein [Isoptericola sp. b515]MDO8147517.1 hypothetical protein [Isoptericola sp. b515]